MLQGVVGRSPPPPLSPMLVIVRTIQGGLREGLGEAGELGQLRLDGLSVVGRPAGGFSSRALLEILLIRSLSGETSPKVGLGQASLGTVTDTVIITSLSSSLP